MGNSNSDRKAKEFFTGVGKGITKGVGEIGKFASQLAVPVVNGLLKETGIEINSDEIKKIVSPVIDSGGDALNGLYKNGGRITKTVNGYTAHHPYFGHHHVNPGHPYYNSVHHIISNSDTRKRRNKNHKRYI
jgi:hypothetical protein